MQEIQSRILRKITFATWYASKFAMCNKYAIHNFNEKKCLECCRMNITSLNPNEGTCRASECASPKNSEWSLGPSKIEETCKK